MDNGIADLTPPTLRVTTHSLGNQQWQEANMIHSLVVALSLSSIAFVSKTEAFLTIQHMQELSGRPSRISRCSSATLPLTDGDAKSSSAIVPILPAREPLSSFVKHGEFSLLTWNILLPNSRDNWWCHKQYSSNVDMEKRQWKHRQRLIKERLLQSAADIVCIQEADGDTFDTDFAFMGLAGYDNVLHRKFRFRCATFFKRDMFALDQVSHKDRTLVTTLKCKSTQHVVHVINCHLSGGTAPERRLRQVHDGLEQIRKYINVCQNDLVKQQKGNRPSKKGIEKTREKLNSYKNGGIIVAGDFNSDGNTAVRKLLVEGCVNKDWREPQYPDLPLTSTRREHAFSRFVDAAELAYQGNVCDGDYGEVNSMSERLRPATYVVPSLASRLLLPVGEQESPPRTEFGLQIARNVAQTLNLNDWCIQELDQAFDLVDSDGNGVIDANEIQSLLEQVYVATYGQKMQQERNNFFKGFGTAEELTKEQFIVRLKALQNDNEGERKAFGLAKAINLRVLDDKEMAELFEQIDLDRNGFIDENEFHELLKTAYLSIYGEEISSKRNEFFKSFDTNHNELTKEQFTERLLALYQELEGGRKGSELAEAKTDADVAKITDRFTPILRDSLDELFYRLSSNGVTMTRTEVNGFLIKTNGELGRGGMFRHISALFEQKLIKGSDAELTIDDWYSVFARELAEGKWWQVVYDLEIYGCSVRSQYSNERFNSNLDQLYQGWLDYIYFNGMTCAGVQDVLTMSERKRIYEGESCWFFFLRVMVLMFVTSMIILERFMRVLIFYGFIHTKFPDGDALPNEWHPSDHLPVAAIFSWNLTYDLLNSSETL